MSAPLDPTTERLARAMIDAGFNPGDAMVKLARDGYYDDYKSPLAFPITTLVEDLRRRGYTELAQRAVDGEFDATNAEAKAWARSEEGQQAFRDLVEGR